VGDWISVLGVKSYRNITGPRGLRRRNRKGQTFFDFEKKWTFYITNTWIKKHKRRPYIWKVQGDQNGRQFDYIFVKQQFGRSVKDVQTLSGAGILSDHKVLGAKIGTRLKKIIDLQK